MKIIAFVLSLTLAAAATTAVYHKTQGSDINYYQAHRYFEKGRYNKAIPLYEKSLALKPKRLDALSEIAYSHQWTGGHAPAIGYFERYLSIDPADLKIKKSLAETYSWEKEYDKAERIYKEVIKATGDDEAKVSLAEIFVWTKRWDDACALLAEVLKNRPADIDAKMLLAESLQYSGKTDEAIRLYREILEDESILADIKKAERIRALLGESYMIGKDYVRAIASYEETLRVKSRDVKTRVALADVLSWIGQYERSAAEYRKALEVEPENAGIKKKLATVLTWNKDYAGAEQIFKEIFEKNPSDTEVAAMIAEILVWQKRYKEAIDYLEKALAGKKDTKTRLIMGQAFLYSGDNQKAKEIFAEILASEPGNAEAKAYLADACAYSKDFKRAIALYREALGQKEDREIKRRLADVLSWAKRYGESLELYDELLAQKEDQNIRLQKARVLGWSREYDKSLKEYKKILDIKYDDLIAMEMNAKACYWKGRVRGAIKGYSQLAARAPENTEALFDLSQVYSYQQMWNEAIESYNKILQFAPTHFRAREGLEKALLISDRLMWNTGYDFLEQDSQARDMDIRKHILFNRASYPLTRHIRIDADEKTVFRDFSDFNDLFESDTKIKMSYIHNPLGWVDGFYNVVAYNRRISAIHTFGGSANLRFMDIGVATFSYERERLENNSGVIINHYYMDNFRGRMNVDVTKRLKVNADFLYSAYSDNNERWEPGFDLLYFFSFDPLRFSVRYRYFYRQYENKVSQYFSPRGFTTNSFELNWRHYLNKEEIYFGADDLYYDLLYSVSIDSQKVATHKFGAEINWDINKRMNFNVKGSFSRSSYKIYQDASLTAGLKYFF